VVRDTVASKIQAAETADQKADDTRRPAATQASAAAQPTRAATAGPNKPKAASARTRGPVANDLSEICTA